MNKTKTLLTILFTCTLLSVFSVWSWVKPMDQYSDTERRPLDTFPALNIDSILSADFMNKFEGYTTDQFPLRDTFRGIKAFFVYNVFNQKDNNDIILKDNYITKLEYPLNNKLLDNAANKFEYLYTTYLEGNNHNIYFSIIPDKNYFMIEDDYLSFDYNVLVDTMKSKTSYMKYIDIFNLLSLDDYYRTDTHWKQENILDVANHLMQEMGINPNNISYEINLLTNEDGTPYGFNGVYVGQYGLSIQPDEINYLTSNTINNCKVYSYSSGTKQEIDMYSMTKAYGKDAYEMYLNGTEALIVIENPNAKTEKELILFRDSFGSSIAPLFIENYSKVTLVDIRYMDSKLIGDFIEFNDQDVLFLYSTILLNNSSAFK